MQGEIHKVLEVLEEEEEAAVCAQAPFGGLSNVVLPLGCLCKQDIASPKSSSHK